jgi:hypothetical protein
MARLLPGRHVAGRFDWRKETAASLAGKAGGQPKGREEAALPAEARDDLNHRPTLRNALI